MFFNENLYLEGGSECEATPVTDEEISEAVDEAQADTETGAIEEGMDFYTRCLEGMSLLDESYFNLREKMMNMEHISAIKAKDGLVSESEMLLEASLDSFVDKVKGIFEKMKNLVKNLFNKFVDFIMGLTISVKQIKGVNVEQAWATFSKAAANNGMKVKIMNLKAGEVQKAPAYANVLFMLAASEYDRLEAGYKAATNQPKADEFEKSFERPSKLKDRVQAKKTAIEDFLTGVTEGEKTVVTKSEVAITKELFTERVKYVVDYQKIISEVKRSKDQAHKALDKAIKNVQGMKNPKDSQKKVQGKTISEMRWVGSVTTKSFSKLTSLCSSYYRESLAVSRRVMGANRADAAEAKIKSLGESAGFDVAAYFEN